MPARGAPSLRSRRGESIFGASKGPGHASPRSLNLLAFSPEKATPAPCDTVWVRFAPSLFSDRTLERHYASNSSLVILYFQGRISIVRFWTKDPDQVGCNSPSCVQNGGVFIISLLSGQVRDRPRRHHTRANPGRGLFRGSLRRRLRSRGKSENST